MEDVRDHEQVVVHQVGREALVAGDTRRSSGRDDGMIGAVALEELPDARGAGHLDFPGTVEHVVAVSAKGSHDRGADQCVGAGNVDAGRAFHGRSGSGELAFELVRGHFADMRDRVGAEPALDVLEIGLLREVCLEGMIAELEHLACRQVPGWKR